MGPWWNNLNSVQLRVDVRDFALLVVDETGNRALLYSLATIPSHHLSAKLILI